ncbi:hypothetical protein LB505_011979 [Fusarium chuoi]|nr:hypothetical protein LB505_011979 [Fusarium chuoi]
MDPAGSLLCLCRSSNLRSSLPCAGEVDLVRLSSAFIRRRCSRPHHLRHSDLPDGSPSPPTTFTMSAWVSPR